jgi:hypothetical protein
MKKDTPRYTLFYFEWGRNCIQLKADKTKKAAAKPKRGKPKHRIQWRKFWNWEPLTTTN